MNLFSSRSQQIKYQLPGLVVTSKYLLTADNFQNFKEIVNIWGKVFLPLKCSAGDTQRGRGLILYFLMIISLLNLKILSGLYLGNFKV